MKFPVLKRPEYKRMYGVLKENLAPYFSRAILIVLVIDILKSFMLMSGLLPSINMMMKGEVSKAMVIGSTCLTGVLSFGIRILTEVLSFGVIMYFTNVIVTKNAVFSDCFKSYAQYKSNPWILGILFSLVSAVAVGIIFALMILNPEFFNFSIPDNISPENIQSVINPFIPKLLIIGGVYFVTVYSVKILFAFVCNVVRDDSSLSIGAVLVRSFSLMHRNYFHFIGFNFYICLKNIAILLICYGLEMALPVKIMEKLSFLSLILNFVIFMEQYTILAKIASSVPIYYYSILSVNGLIEVKVQKHESVDFLISDEENDAELNNIYSENSENSNSENSENLSLADSENLNSENSNSGTSNSSADENDSDKSSE